MDGDPDYFDDTGFNWDAIEKDLVPLSSLESVARLNTGEPVQTTRPESVLSETNGSTAQKSPVSLPSRNTRRNTHHAAQPIPNITRGNGPNADGRCVGENRDSTIARQALAGSSMGSRARDLSNRSALPETRVNNDGRYRPAFSSKRGRQATNCNREEPRRSSDSILRDILSNRQVQNAGTRTPGGGRNMIGEGNAIHADISAQPRKKKRSFSTIQPEPSVVTKRRTIPGPAGILQATMGQTRGSNEDRRVMNVSRIECTQDSAFDTHEHDNVAEDTLGDFRQGPWLKFCFSYCVRPPNAPNDYVPPRRFT